MSYSSLQAMTVLYSYELREELLTMDIVRRMNCLMVEVLRELQLVQAVLQKVMLALQNKSAQIIKNPGGDPLYKPIR